MKIKNKRNLKYNKKTCLNYKNLQSLIKNKKWLSNQKIPKFFNLQTSSSKHLTAFLITLSSGMNKAILQHSQDACQIYLIMDLMCININPSKTLLWIFKQWQIKTKRSSASSTKVYHQRSCSICLITIRSSNKEYFLIRAVTWVKAKFNNKIQIWLSEQQVNYTVLLSYWMKHFQSFIMRNTKMVQWENQDREWIWLRRVQVGLVRIEDRYIN